MRVFFKRCDLLLIVVVLVYDSSTCETEQGNPR